MDIGSFFQTLLTPIKWVIEALLVGFHWLLTTLGMNPAAGLTWVLSIVGLVLVVRALLIPIFVRQIKSQRKMLEVAPQLKKIQDKYKGKKDQFSREAMQRETMELYRKAGTSPFSSCLPLLIQMPIFFSLFSVLNEARNDKAGVGLLTRELSDQFYNAELFPGAGLKFSIQSALEHNPVLWPVVILAGLMVIAMTASQFVTQLQIMAKNQSPEMKESPMFRQQRILLYILPLVFAFSGFAFPIGVMFYWLTSNVWTMIQQFLVIRNMPTPGSEAALAREARLAKRARRKMGEDAAALEAAEAAELETKKATTQRQQPVGKSRAKKSGGNKR
ncbi:membrane protein insertase YidC [Schumannella soli]|uniref:Membrane protein insertase YidC n=1 Tax=Schumannella soli TaxID=2590779 RepID=A0A506Y9M0_9MICO|nr:membrane protein insertase YidC [Schumannella soli]TPW77808.1 membrane protein insertase YidC [Schumannella soli]